MIHAPTTLTSSTNVELKLDIAEVMDPTAEAVIAEREKQVRADGATFTHPPSTNPPASPNRQGGVLVCIWCRLYEVHPQPSPKSAPLHDLPCPSIAQAKRKKSTVAGKTKPGAPAKKGKDKAKDKKGAKKKPPSR